MHQDVAPQHAPVAPRKRRVRPMMYYPLRSYGPTIVWLGAIAVAVALYDHVQVAGSAVGYAMNEAVSVAHIEAGVVKEVHVGLHDHVRPSQILITMDDRDERLRLAGIEKEVERLKAAIEAEKAQMAAGNARADMDGEDLERRFLIDRETAQAAYIQARGAGSLRPHSAAWSSAGIRAHQGALREGPGPVP